MKKSILFGSALLMMGLAQTASAQLRINAFGGYTFQDQFTLNGYYNGYSYQEGRVDAGAHFGGSLEFMMQQNAGVELLYQYQSTTAHLRTAFSDNGPYDLNVSYIMLGGIRYAPFSPVVSGYGGLNLGVAIMGGQASATKFAWGGKLGLMFNMSDNVGIKLGMQLLSPVQGAGGGFYLGTGGASAGVSTYSSIYQFGFTGGLCFTLPDQADKASPVHGVKY
jgi:hypothetical protein